MFYFAKGQDNFNTRSKMVHLPLNKMKFFFFLQILFYTESTSDIYLIFIVVEFLIPEKTHDMIYYVLISFEILNILVCTLFLLSLYFKTPNQTPCVVDSVLCGQQKLVMKLISHVLI